MNAVWLVPRRSASVLWDSETCACVLEWGPASHQPRRRDYRRPEGRAVVRAVFLASAAPSANVTLPRCWRRWDQGVVRRGRGWS